MLSTLACRKPRGRDMGYGDAATLRPDGALSSIELAEAKPPKQRPRALCLGRLALRAAPRPARA